MVIRDRRHRDAYVNYYLNQARQVQGGGSLPVFGGARYQKGHGLGAIFARIRAALPRLFRSFGGHALKTAANVGSDLLGGKKIGEIVKPRLMEGLKSAAGDLAPRSWRL